MPTEMKLWQINKDVPIAVQQHKLDLESRLEEWICYDIDLISTDLLLIGQQVETAYGKFIDLLAIDHVGNLVILELKRDKTPRDIVAQALDYASWVKDLSHEEIMEIANTFLKNKTLEQAFQEAFTINLPDVLNERHRMYIVASSLDSATERIVKYLSETYDVDINVVTFTFFKMEQDEMLGRSMLLDEEQVQTRAMTKSKRRSNLTWEELELHAEQHGILPLYQKVINELKPLFNGVTRHQSGFSLVGIFEESKCVLMGIYPEASIPDKGIAIMIYIDELCECFELEKEKFITFLSQPALDAETWSPEITWWFDNQRLESLIKFLSEENI